MYMHELACACLYMHVPPPPLSGGQSEGAAVLLYVSTESSGVEQAGLLEGRSVPRHTGVRVMV